MQQTGLMADIATASKGSQSPKINTQQSKKPNDDLKKYFLKSLRTSIQSMQNQAQTSGRSPKQKFIVQQRANTLLQQSVTDSVQSTIQSQQSYFAPFTDRSHSQSTTKKANMKHGTLPKFLPQMPFQKANNVYAESRIKEGILKNKRNKKSRVESQNFTNASKQFQQSQNIQEQKIFQQRPSPKARSQVRSKVADSISGWVVPDSQVLSAEDVPILIGQLQRECIQLNKEAMVYLHRDDDLSCSELLQQAKCLLKQWRGLESQQSIPYIKIKALTLNNFGCFYKKQGKLYAALKSLEQALELEKTYLKHFDESTSTQEIQNAFFEHAKTYLNICAICSQLGKHYEAIQKTLMAITFLKRSIRLLLPHSQATSIPQDEDEHQEIFKIVHFFAQNNNFHGSKKGQSRSPVSYGEKKKKEDVLLRFSDAYLTSKQTSIEAIWEIFDQADELMDESGDMAQRKNKLKGHTTTLVAAYYNLGACFEHLKNWQLALSAFQIALTHCLKFLKGSNTEIRDKIQESIVQVQQRAAICHTNRVLRQIRRDDLAPNSLDPMRLETLREKKASKAQKLASEWIKKPLKALGHQEDKSSAYNKKLETVDMLYDQHIRKIRHEDPQTSFDTSFDRPFFEQQQSQAGNRSCIQKMPEIQAQAHTERRHTNHRVARSFAGNNMKNLIEQVPSNKVTIKNAIGLHNNQKFITSNFKRQSSIVKSRYDFTQYQFQKQDRLSASIDQGRNRQPPGSIQQSRRDISNRVQAAEEIKFGSFNKPMTANELNFPHGRGNQRNRAQKESDTDMTRYE